MTRSAAPVLLALSALVAGCAPAPNATIAPTRPPIVEASPTAASPGVSTLPAFPSPSPLASPVGPPAFTKPVPPGAGTAWSGIHWRKLASDDPLARVRSVVRWRGGFVALGTVLASGQTSSTPLWVSTDGASWRPLDPQVFGPATVVIGVGETATGIVALTLQGGANQCDGQSTRLNCWMPTAPLQSWTSSDATSWTAHPGPAGIALPMVGCDSCGVAVPIFRSGIPGLLVVNDSGTTAPAGSRVAFSRDGIAWENLPAAAFPAGFDFHDLEAFQSGFIATGDQNVTIDAEETICAVALSSSDGRAWVTRDLPHDAGFDPRLGSLAPGLVIGPEGLIAEGGEGVMSTIEVWWSSVSGRSWHRLAGYPPLGVDPNAQAGGRINGTLLGDGERMLAYRGGDRPVAWMSRDGRSWRTVAIGGSRPTPSGTLVLMPIGVLWIGDDGSTWFGDPVV